MVNASNFSPKPVAALIGVEALAREHVLEPMLTRGSVSLLYGPGGVGKSFLALGLAFAAAAGGSLFGWRAPRPQKVLYIDGEMGRADMRERLALFGSPPPPALKILTADGSDAPLLDLAQPDNQERLMAEWDGPDLLILDAVCSLTGLRWDSDRSWAHLHRFLLHQKRHGRTVLLLHNTNRKGGMRGSARRDDGLDLVMALRRPEAAQPSDGTRFEIHFEKARRLHGDVLLPLLVHFATDEGGICWNWERVHPDRFERGVALLKRGLDAAAMGRALGMSRTVAFRLQQEARRRGLLPPGAKGFGR
jgi:hypothetical protein